MIAAGDARVEEYGAQFGRRGKREVALLGEFSGEGLKDRFAGFNAAAGEMPAGNISVAHEKDAVLRVNHASLRPKCHAAGKAEVGVKSAAAQSNE